MLRVVVSRYQSTNELTVMALVSGTLAREGRQGQQEVATAVVETGPGDGVTGEDVTTMDTSTAETELLDSKEGRNTSLRASPVMGMPKDEMKVSSGTVGTGMTSREPEAVPFKNSSSEVEFSGKTESAGIELDGEGVVVDVEVVEEETAFRVVGVGRAFSDGR